MRGLACEGCGAPAAAHDAGEGQCHPPYSVRAVEDGGHRKHSVLVPEEGLHDPRSGQADGVVRRPLPAMTLWRCLRNFAGGFFEVVRREDRWPGTSQSRMGTGPIVA